MEWFTCTEEKVEGPYEADQLKELIASRKLPPNCFVWGRGQNEWRKAADWAKTADQVVEQLKPSKKGQAWHFAIDGESKGPMSRAELIHELRNIRDKNEILVWTKGMKQWADLFEFHDLVDELGLNRRSQPRAKITGSLKVHFEDGSVQNGHLRTCSEGGIGGGGFQTGLTMGQSVHLEVQADGLGESFSVKAQVQYVTDTGYIGFKFLSIGSEAKSRILQYINSNKHPDEKAAA